MSRLPSGEEKEEEEEEGLPALTKAAGMMSQFLSLSSPCFIFPRTIFYFPPPPLPRLKKSITAKGRNEKERRKTSDVFFRTATRSFSARRPHLFLSSFVRSSPSRRNKTYNPITLFDSS